MPSIFPAVANAADFQSVRTLPFDTWLRGLEVIRGRHGIEQGQWVRFASGENPVFRLDDRYVLKLVPTMWEDILSRERESLQFLATHPQFPVARIVAGAAIEDWTYQISTLLPGMPMDVAWEQMERPRQLDMARRFGELLRQLHTLPIGEFRPGGIEWPEFVDAQIAGWEERHAPRGVPAALVADGPVFLRDARALCETDERVFLHGDLAPENVLVQSVQGEWGFSGLFDFGNAMVGDGRFELTAAGLLMARGDAELLGPFMNAYGLRGAELDARMQTVLMAYTLIHPLADLCDCLGLVPGATACVSWEQVAHKFWPL